MDKENILDKHIRKANEIIDLINEKEGPFCNRPMSASEVIKEYIRVYLEATILAEAYKNAYNEIKEQV